MISLSNIRHISRYESKAIKRGWFFKIATIGIIGFFSIFILTALGTIFPGTGEWDLGSLAAKWPYSIMFILNMILPFVVVFLATGLMKKNKKLDTNEVFLTRPVSNADYVLGRVMALLKPLLVIHIILLILLLAVNLMSEDAPFDPVNYIFYPLMISLPNLVFVTGLSFLTVSLIRNQAVSLVVILAILGTLLIEFSRKYYHLMDFNASSIPLLQSDMLGIYKVEGVLYQRAMFVALGISFLSLAILLLDRLPMKRLGRVYAVTIGILALACSVFLGYNYLEITQWIPQQTREIARGINDKMYGIENIDITDCDLKLVHSDQLTVKARLVVKNKTNTTLKSYYFYLNPGLNIDRITQNGQPLDYSRELHKIKVNIASPLSPNTIDSLNIFYTGNIDESIAYLGVEKERLETPYHMEMFSVPKRTAFVTADYLLLTSEVLWYPTAYPDHVPSIPGYRRRNFVNYTLEVNTRNDLTPISQGKMLQKSDNGYLFTPEQALPQISLIVGNYENRSVTVDSADYNFTTYKGHDYFLKYYDHVQDTIPEVVRILRKKTEQRAGWKYPFKRFSLVEVPATFHAYFTLSQNHQAYSQPEMVFMPEMGGEIFFADLRRFFDNIDRWRFEGQKVTDKKRQAHAAHDYLLQFLKNNYTVNTQRDQPREAQFYTIMPNMLWFIFDIQSDEWPLLTKNLDDHLNPIVANNSFWSSAQTLTEECNNLIRGKNMGEALSTEEKFLIKSQIVKLIGKTMTVRLQELLGEVSINDFFAQLMEEKGSRSISFDDLKQEFSSQYNIDLETVIKDTYASKQQPFYSFDNLESYALSEGNAQRYQVKFEVTNLSEVPGIVQVEIKDQEDRAIIEQGIISLAPNETKKWASVTNQRPRLSINTLISQNIPQRITLSPREFEVKANRSPEDGITTIANNRISSNEIIVDNEDSTFYTVSETNPPLLQQLAFDNLNVSEYENIYRAPRGRWSKTSNNNYFGKHIRSAHFVRTGKGDKKAVWATQIKDQGYYDIYAYTAIGEVWWNDQNKKTEINHYIIHHADGEDEVTLDRKKEKGWVFLGSYYLNVGETKVELTNESDHRLVFADAIKWTRNDVISTK